MIPGPVEVSPRVLSALGGPPPSHLAPDLIAAFGESLRRMRALWRAGEDSQPFLVAGGGTLAMEMAAVSSLAPGDAALVISSGYFSARFAEMLRRHGIGVRVVEAPVGEAPDLDRVVEALDGDGPFGALFATHVDTSTGVRVDPRPLAALARERGVLSVFDGVCATAAEPFEMEAWGADVYLTGSQKALGLPPGLALMVVSPRALEASAALPSPRPPLYLDWQAWLPIMKAYEEGRPSYFSTPATSLIPALAASLGEILDEGLEERWAAHARAARALGAAWDVLGLERVPVRPEITASTLSALYFPAGVDASLLARIRERGVIVAGGLHEAIRERYFRIGHMGYAVTRPEMLLATVEAVAGALAAGGRRDATEEAIAAAAGELGRASPGGGSA